MSNFLSMWSDLDDLIEAGFGEPLTLRFATNHTSDKMPSFWQKWMVEDEENPKAPKKFKGFKAIVRTIGVDEKDIDVSCGKSYGQGSAFIQVQGKTEYDGYVYRQDVKLLIPSSVLDNIKEVTYSVRNGLTHIYIEVNPEKKNEIPVKKV